MRRIIYIYFLLVLLSVFMLPISLYAQCMANAGGDKHKCENDSIQFGSNPTASLGVPPYIYEWWITPIPFIPPSFPYLFASNILNDTTLSNPILIYNNLCDVVDSLTLYVRITDSNGCQSTDSCKLTFSVFNQHLTTWSYNINQGDSIYLNQVPNVGGGFGNSTYSWAPTHGLNIANLPSGFWAKPDTSIAYTATVIDSKGCQKTGGGPTYYINVGTVGYNEIGKENIKLFPNPTNDIVYILYNSKISSIIRVYNSVGQNIATVIGENELSFMNFPNGIYHIEIQTENSNTWHKVIKN